MFGRSLPPQCKVCINELQQNVHSKSKCHVFFFLCIFLLKLQVCLFRHLPQQIRADAKPGALDCSLHKALLIFWSHHPTQSVIMRPQIGTARGLAPNPFKQTCPAKCPWWFWPNPQKAIFSRLWAGNTCSQPGIWSVTVQQSHKLSPTASPFSEPWQSSVAAFFWARQAMFHG